MLGMHTAQEAYKEIVQNLWKNAPWLKIKTNFLCHGMTWCRKAGSDIPVLGVEVSRHLSVRPR